MSTAVQDDDLKFLTFGCRLNAFETEVMREFAHDEGLKNAVIVNSCAVTGEAVRQARQAIRKARRENPGSRIIVTGCAAQTETARFSQMQEVDHVIGNAEKAERSTFARLACGTDHAPRVEVADIMEVRETAGHLIGGFGSRARAFVQVQNGCDHRCTFCIIPFGRGPSRSLSLDHVVEQVARLAGEGYAEVVLTGVDITSWGGDLPGCPSLGQLVRGILARVPELQRLRISSIDSVEADDDLIDALANEQRLMPHLHLSLQSGDDMILKRMKRRHLARDAVEFCARARAARPDIVFGADFIAGFPTETEQMFEATLDHVADCGLTYLHVFPFSPRPGTPAARMPPVPSAKVKARARRLRSEGVAAQRDYLGQETGKVRQVLVERPGFGRSEHFAGVELAGPAQAGELVAARITGTDGERLFADQVL
ncbi:MAG: tRNA (N(6)-L-threonylcarbamoyladenosine(37)-C(2))-methylthiotransferase MtaB [Rhizobiales bacterium]|nr:tRNA (N(6)-L-threonylcarbamoyladenosine(37)-C(2))-methylthiotransferase MtaB [Hyphomicrobiales bacterium]